MQVETGQREEGFTLPPKYQRPKRVNGLVLLWRVSWPSLLLPTLLWPFIIWGMSPEDTLADCAEFGFFIATRFAVAHLFFLVMFGVPYCCLGCINPDGFQWRWWFIIPASIFSGILAIQLAGYFIKKESLMFEAPELLAYGIAYGFITGVVAFLRRPKPDREMNQETQVGEMPSKYRDRFGSVQAYMKEVKERFSRWYNKRYGRRGTLWMDRFKSVLVEDAEAKIMMAAYIDLNPVRAGLVKDPQDYRWCGYAEAEAGGKRAKRGLCRAMGAALDSWDKNAGLYRCWLFENGRALRDEEGVVKRKGVDEGKRNEVFAAKGKQPLSTKLLHRIRYLTTGLAIGSPDFIRKLKTTI